MTWNFSASGQGKRAPDGIGGFVRRTADRLVATGADIVNVKTLLVELQAQCPNVHFAEITT